MMQHPHALRPSERLRSLGAVRRLFQHGEGGFVFPISNYILARSDVPVLLGVLFSVPKKFHKRANRRNLLRRRTKEAYRLQKQLLTNHCGQSNVDLALIYSSKEVLPYKTIAHAVRRILENVAERL